MRLVAYALIFLLSCPLCPLVSPARRLTPGCLVSIAPRGLSAWPAPPIRRRRWFLESLLERSRPDGNYYWLRQITLECMDNMARHTACHLISHACCSGANDRAEAESLVATDRATGRALHR